MCRLNTYDDMISCFVYIYNTLQQNVLSVIFIRTRIICILTSVKEILEFLFTAF